MSVFIAYDIETSANPRATEYYERKARNNVYQAPSNWKDEKKIEKHVEEAKKKDRESAALHWWTGQIICISAYDLSSKGTVSLFCPETKDQYDEAKLLTNFFDYLWDKAQEHSRGVTLIGKQNSEFDDGYLVGRAMVHSLGIPHALRRRESHSDVNNFFSISRASAQRGRLDDYAFGLDLPMKLGGGADVPKWWAEGKLDTIRHYAERDIEITGEIVRRYLKTYTRSKVNV
jgi:hypothetical protein